MKSVGYASLSIGLLFMAVESAVTVYSRYVLWSTCRNNMTTSGCGMICSTCCEPRNENLDYVSLAKPVRQGNLGIPRNIGLSYVYQIERVKSAGIH